MKLRMLIDEAVCVARDKDGLSIFAMKGEVHDIPDATATILIKQDKAEAAGDAPLTAAKTEAAPDSKKPGRKPDAPQT